MRRGEALDASPLLVDEHRGIAAHRVADGRDQAAQLRRRVDVAAEEDEPPRLALRRRSPAGHDPAGHPRLYESVHDIPL